MKRKIDKIEDLENNLNFHLIQNYQDIEEVLKDLGLPNDNTYGCLFVEMLEGEYGEIYGCESNIPYLHYRLDKLR
jgi:virulence-associated protein VapD